MEHRSKSNLKSASDVLQSLLGNSKSPLSDQFTRWKLWRKWPEVVGQTISEHAIPVGFDRGVLYVWVKSSSWMQQMVFVSKPLKDKINQFVGMDWVSQIRFTLDRKSVPDLPKDETSTENQTEKK